MGGWGRLMSWTRRRELKEARQQLEDVRVFLEDLRNDVLQKKVAHLEHVLIKEEECIAR